MKITKVEAIPLSAPIKKAIMDSRLRYTKREALLVCVETDSGIYGIGESAIHGGGMRGVACEVEELGRWIEGENPLYIERIWEMLYQRSMQHGRRGVAIMAISGIDIALWDILGKVANLPLYKLLGAFRDKIPAYASAGFYAEGKDVKRLSEEMRSYIDKGFKAVKMKVGRKPSPLLPDHRVCYTSLDEDLARVEAVRKAIGEDVVLMLDANNAWELKEAIQAINKFKAFNPYFIEEPLATDDVEASAILTQNIDIPVAGYETAYTRFEFRRLIEKRAVDIVQPDVSWAGGITEARKIATIASSYNMPCIPHSFSSAVNLVATLHFLASIPNSRYIELDQNPNPLRENLLTEPIFIDSSGNLQVPDKPGLGIELNEDVLNCYRVS
ncbi:mandelate racemase/muconate lactonizing enzyme family protein [Candidatus Aerophobetes bacterium]|nr:mandelate racemase/muconate lactonizing enzyme family protein [Candidatus Aerophobetes bacterium]